VTTARFATARSDGRTNTQVVVDLIADGVPGTIYTYDDVLTALNAGAPKAYSVTAAQAAVRTAAKTIARVQQRALQNVPGVGYRLAMASEHRSMAVTRESKAERQIRMALMVLKNVKWDEMDPQTRSAHVAHLQVSEALYLNQRALDKRLRSTEQAIEGLREAVLKGK
jgi:hypothetical protein